MGRRCIVFSKWWVTSMKEHGACQGKGGTRLPEDMTIIYSFAPPESIVEAENSLLAFLHAYGRETGQKKSPSRLKT
jgi:hypothetical protein